MKPRALRKGDTVVVTRPASCFFGQRVAVVGRSEFGADFWQLEADDGWFTARREHLRALPRRRKGARHA